MMLSYIFFILFKWYVNWLTKINDQIYFKIMIYQVCFQVFIFNVKLKGGMEHSRVSQVGVKDSETFGF